MLGIDEKELNLLTNMTFTFKEGNKKTNNKHSVQYIIKQTNSS